MTTAREQMRGLSLLVDGNTARDHFLSIVLGGGTQLVEGLIMSLDAAPEIVIDPDILFNIDDNEIALTVDDEITLVIEP